MLHSNLLKSNGKSLFRAARRARKPRPTGADRQSTYNISSATVNCRTWPSSQPAPTAQCSGWQGSTGLRP
jgi:hypothetical protein